MCILVSRIIKKGGIHMRKNNTEPFEIPETAFVQSTKYLIVRGVKHSKQELVEHMKYNHICR